MGTPAAITKIMACQKAIKGKVRYSEEVGTRLAHGSGDAEKATDCSGMAIRMYLMFGGDAMAKKLHGATYTGNLCDKGRVISTSRSSVAACKGMLVGDLIFFDWGSYTATWDHVAIYAGGGRMWNHGGPGHGPINLSVADSVWAASRVRVIRLIEPTSGPTPKPSGKHLRHGWPSFMHRGDYFGLKEGPDHSRGGANSFEKPAIKLIKQRLHDLGYRGFILSSGTFGAGTKKAVAAWQKKHYASTTTNYGEVWQDDWNHLFYY